MMMMNKAYYTLSTRLPLHKLFHGSTRRISPHGRIHTTFSRINLSVNYSYHSSSQLLLVNAAAHVMNNNDHHDINKVQEMIKQMMQDVTRCIEEGQNCWSSGEHNKSVELATKALERINQAQSLIDPNMNQLSDKYVKEKELLLNQMTSQAYTTRAMANMEIHLKEESSKTARSGIFNEIQKDFQFAIEICPTNEQALFGYGYLLSRMGMIDTAIRYFDQSIEIKPDVPIMYLKRAEALDRRGVDRIRKDDVSRIVRDTSLAISLGSNDPRLYLLRGKYILHNFQVFGDKEPIKGEMWNLDQAVSDLSQAIQLGYREGQVFYLRGLCHIFMNEIQLGIQDLSMCKKESPVYSELVDTTIAELARVAQEQQQQQQKDKNNNK